MKVLLVEPEFRRLSRSKKAQLADSPNDAPASSRSRIDDESLWYPPLGLMKLSRFHKDRGDEVRFVCGCDSTLFKEADLFSPAELWDRVYVATLFTFDWKTTIRTIDFYKATVGGTVNSIFVGGIMASLMANDIHEETGVYPVTGVITSPQQIGLRGNVNIDLLPPDYSILDGRLYAINATYYAYTSRGCVKRCPWCGVPKIEPEFVPYIDIKPAIRALREQYGDKPKLKLMDNNVLASPELERIVADLVALGYGRDCFTATEPKRQRVIDFNQGLDAAFLSGKRMRLLSHLSIKPMRLAFDRLEEEPQYLRAVEIARHHGVTKFSAYMLYNFRDTPRDVYERLKVNIKLNKHWGKGGGNANAEVYSYPMRYAPINETDSPHANRRRDYVTPPPRKRGNLLKNAAWTRRFVRNVEIMKGAAHGAISPTPGLALRTIGETYEEFIANLYMPEILLRNRNRYERKVYPGEPERQPGTGDVEKFRKFILRNLRKPTKTFLEFHEAVSANTRAAVRRYLSKCRSKEMKSWLELYLGR